MEIVESNFDFMLGPKNQFINTYSVAFQENKVNLCFVTSFMTWFSSTHLPQMLKDKKFKATF